MCHILFIIVVYLLEFIYIIRTRYLEDKKIQNFNNFFICLFLFLLPIFCGFVYYVLPHIIQIGSGGQFLLNIEGYIYRNVWSNFIFLYGNYLLLF